jgi:hypothetical protein
MSALVAGIIAAVGTGALLILGLYLDPAGREDPEERPAPEQPPPVPRCYERRADGTYRLRG